MKHYVAIEVSQRSKYALETAINMATDQFKRDTGTAPVGLLINPLELRFLGAEKEAPYNDMAIEASMRVPFLTVFVVDQENLDEHRAANAQPPARED